MANTLLTISMITRESTRILENNLVFTKRVQRKYDDQFGKAGAKIGTVLNIRKPPRYIGRVGQGLQLEDATETSVPLVLTTQRGVDIAFTSQDLALSIDDFSKRFIKPAISKVANGIDRDGLQQYVNIYHQVGTPGTTPNTLLTYLDAGVKLDNSAADRDDSRCVIINPLMQATIVDALKGLFQSSSQISEQYEKGKMGTSAGFEWYMDQNTWVQTIGPLGGTPLVNGNNQSGASLLTKGWTSAAASRLALGDIFTIANVNSVNPVNLQDTGELAQFVVTAPFSSDSSGNGSVSISPSITLTGPFQTVTALPVDGAAITVYGAASTHTPQGLAFVEDTFAFASADLPLPGGVDMASRVSDDQLGMSIRLIRAYDINTDRYPCRLDILYGFTTIYAETGCRICA